MGLLSSVLWGILCFVILCVMYLVYILYSHTKYFKKHNIPYIGAGASNFAKMMIGKLSIVDWEMETYRKAVACNTPIVGLTNLLNLSKVIYVTDMETLKNVYVKDFDHFINRPAFTSQNNKEYISKMLFTMENDQWKTLRAKMTPMFTTGKIRRMFQTFEQSSENMATYIKNHIGSKESKEDLDFSHLFIKYILDVIAGTAFGFDCKTWEVPVGQESKFEEMGHRYQFNFSPIKLLQFMLMFVAPKIYDLFGFKTMDESAEKYFEDIIKHVIKERRQTGERKDDFLQLMLDLQAGTLKMDDADEEEIKGAQKINTSGGGAAKLTFSDFDLVANSLQFLLAGFDSSQSVLCFALYAIIREQEVQQKLYEEVKSKMDQNGGKLTYDGLMDMAYLDLVINESLRMYSPNTQTQRICTKDYQINGTDFKIEKGLDITLPMYPMQYDQRYYPNPDKFIPERFTPENKQSRSSYAWNPFGHGLRGCIAMRFALIKVKAVMAVLVYHFHFSPSAKTLIPMEFSQAASLKPKGGLWIKVTPRR